MNTAKKFNLWMGIALLILCFFIIFVVYPLILILYKSVIDPESSKLTLDYFTKFFARKYYWSTLVNSFYVTVCSTIIASVIGLPMAYVLRSVKIPGSKYLNILIVISYLSPPFIGAYAWIQLLGRNGFVTQIINSIFGVKLDGIYGFAGIVIVITLLLFFLQRYIAGHYSYSMTALKPMEAVEAKGSKKIFAYLFVYGVTFLAMLPQLTVIFTSFLEVSGGAVYTGNFSLQNYMNTLFAKDNNSITNTYLFGICAIFIVVFMGIFISYLTVRKRSYVTEVLDTVTMFPYIIPGSVLGISFLYAFNKQPLILSGTALIIIISLAIRRMPYTIRSSTAIITQISPSIEEAAISLGATEFKSFWKVTVPMMLPGVLAGAIMSWITLISELSSSIILYTSKTSTLTVAIYTEVIRSNFGNAAAYSTVLTLTSIISLLIFFKLTHNKDISV